MFGGATFHTYLPDGLDEPFEIVRGACHSEDAGRTHGRHLLWCLVEVSAFAADDEIADDLFLVAYLPDETAGGTLDLVGV